MRYPAILQQIQKQVRAKGTRYWLIVFALVTIGTITGQWLGQRYIWIQLRYRIYGAIQNATRVTTVAKNTRLVLIDDDVYWSDELARRVPLNRDYLAKLVSILAKAEPTVIALDIDLRSPNPEKGPNELEAYRVETENLFSTIKKVAKDRRVVLATSVVSDDAGYSVSPNVFDNYNFEGSKVSHGYVTLPKDLRQVPLSVPLKNSSARETSFAAAIVKTQDEGVVSAAEQYEHRGFPYGSFYSPEEFKKVNASALAQMTDSDLKDALQGKIVIVGGAWHTGSYKGDKPGYDGAVDLHFTPAGNIPGAFVHANYVEALLGGVHRQVPEAVAIVIEVLCSLLVATVFALEGSLRQKFGRVLLLSLLLVIMSYLMWQNLGLYFDFFIPFLLLSIHAPIEQLRETTAELHRLRKRELTEKITDEEVLLDSASLVVDKDAGATVKV